MRPEISLTFITADSPSPSSFRLFVGLTRYAAFPIFIHIRTKLAFYSNSILPLRFDSLFRFHDCKVFRRHAIGDLNLPDPECPSFSHFQTGKTFVHFFRCKFLNHCPTRYSFFCAVNAIVFSILTFGNFRFFYEKRSPSASPYAFFCH